jgi:hypothetical protein
MWFDRNSKQIAVKSLLEIFFHIKPNNNLMESIAKLFNIYTLYAIDSRSNELLHMMNTRNEHSI